MIWIQPWVWLTNTFVYVCFPSYSGKHAFMWIISTYEYNTTQFSLHVHKK